MTSKQVDTKVRCILCGKTPNASYPITVDIATGEIVCRMCDARYTVANVRATMAAWGELVSWLEQHPGRSS